jgi:hypothetical protein
MSMESTILHASTDDSDEDYFREGDMEGGEITTGERPRRPSAVRSNRPKKDKKKGKGKSDEDDSSDDEDMQRTARKDDDDRVERRDRGEELVRKRMRQRKKEKKVTPGLLSVPPSPLFIPGTRIIFGCARMSVLRPLMGSAVPIHGATWMTDLFLGVSRFAGSREAGT